MSAQPFASPQAVGQWVRETAGGMEDLVGATLFCGSEAADRALCLVDVKPDCVPTVAQRLGGQPFGFSSITIKLSLATDFSCPARKDCPEDLDNCSCRLDWQPA